METRVGMSIYRRGCAGETPACFYFNPRTWCCTPQSDAWRYSEGIETGACTACNKMCSVYSVEAIHLRVRLITLY